MKLDIDQIRRLRVVWQETDRKADALAYDFGISRPTLTRHVKGLRRRGIHDAEIRRLAEEGFTPAEIARQVGLTHPSVTRKLRQWFPVLPTNRSQQRNDEIRRLSLEGLRPGEIAQKLGISRPAVVTRLDRLLPERPRLRELKIATQERYAAMHARHEAGASHSVIAREFGFRTQSVKVLLSKYRKTLR